MDALSTKRERMAGLVASGPRGSGDAQAIVKFADSILAELQRTDRDREIPLPIPHAKEPIAKEWTPAADPMPHVAIPQPNKVDITPRGYAVEPGPEI